MGYEAYDTAEAKRLLNTECETNTTDVKCVGYEAYDTAEAEREAERNLDEYCSYEDEDIACVGYEAYDTAEAEREAKKALDTECETNTTDVKCAGYDAYDTAEAKRLLDTECETNTTDVKCVGYDAYDTAEAKRYLDAYCADEVDDVACAGYDAYKAKKALDEKCASDLAHIDCASYPGYAKAKLRANTFWKYRPRIDVSGWAVIDYFHYHKGTNPKASLEVCLNKCTDYDNCGGVVFDEYEELCWGRLDDDVRDNAFESKWPKKRNLYEKTSNPNDINEPWNFCSNDENMFHPFCKPQLDEKCATNTIDEDCAGYPAYKAARKEELNAYCADEVDDVACAGYDAYKAKKALDEKCADNVEDEACADYPAYKAKKELDEKCADNVEDVACAGYDAYELEMQCGSGGNIMDPLCFVKMCLKKDTPSICEENPDRIRIRSIADEVDDEILEEFCKDSKFSGNFKWDAPSACRSTGGRCGGTAGGGKCSGNACCSGSDWCAGTTGGRRTAHCAYSDGKGGWRGRNGGKYDGTASRDEADKIARRPADFLDTVYQRVEAKKALDTLCADEVDDVACAGYDAYKAARKEELDAYCADEVDDVACAGYDAYKAKKALDEKCADNVEDEACADYPAYKAKKALDALCADEVDDVACAGYDAYKAARKEELDAYCADEVDDVACAGYDAYKAKKALDEKCADNVEDEACADYPAYKAKKELDEKCATNTTDEDCADYPAYKANVEANTFWKYRPVLDVSGGDLFHYYKSSKPKASLEVCLNKCTDYGDDCGGVVFDKNEELCWGKRKANVTSTTFIPYWKDRNLYQKTSDPNDINEPWNFCSNDENMFHPFCKPQLDEKCATNTIDEDCAGYPAYKAKKELDEKCADNVEDVACAGYDAYELEMQCGSGGNIMDPLCFVKMCLKKDTPSICEENPDRIRIRSVAKEVDDEILEEFCKDSKFSNGSFKWDAPSACRSTDNRCGIMAGGGKCNGDACCSYSNWCGGTTGGRRTAHCRSSDGKGGYTGQWSGRYDGDASRQEADKIARRPADFLDTVYQRVQERKAS